MSKFRLVMFERIEKFLDFHSRSLIRTNLKLLWKLEIYHIDHSKMLIFHCLVDFCGIPLEREKIVLFYESFKFICLFLLIVHYFLEYLMPYLKHQCQISIIIAYHYTCLRILKWEYDSYFFIIPALILNL